MSGISMLDAGWLARLQARLDMPPTRPRVPLVLAPGGARPRVIGSLETGLALDLAGAGFALCDTGDAWQLELPRGADADPVLARLARWLHEAGRAGGWRDELLDVTDEAGRPCGAIERAAVRPLGIVTRAVHLLVSDPAGSAWVQQRALNKAVDPGLWDTTVGGLMAAGESVDTALERETWEEAGLRMAQLRAVRPLGRFTVRRPVPEGYMVEHIEMFEAVAPTGTVPENQDGEVSGFACLPREQLVERLRADAFTTEAAMMLVRWLGAAG